MPADAAADPEASFSAISCSSAGNCAAVGLYTGTSGGESMAVAETNGIWGRAVQPAPPSNGQAGSVQLNDISCAPGGVCTAVGSYRENSNSDGDAMVVSETNGVWGTATEITLPANAYGDPEATLNAISCGAAGSCAAVGDYQKFTSSPSFFGYVPLAVSESGGHWGVGVDVATPGGTQGGQLNLVSCPPSGACAAVGEYPSGSGASQEELEFATSGTSAGWNSGTALAGPSGAGSDTTYLQSLSCPAAGDCSGVGFDVTSSSGAATQTGDEVVDSEAGGSWAPASTVTLPSADTGAAEAALGQVSCWAPGDCSAVGGVISGDTATPTTFLKETNGAWGAATAYPAGLANSLSCPPSGACVAVGVYFDQTSQTEAAGAFDYANGEWSAPVDVASPTGSTQSSPELQWVSCASDGSCGAVGFYTDAAGDQLAMGTGDVGDQSTTAVACQASSSSSNETCTATVAGNATAGAPTGTVTFSTTAGAFPAGTTCSLASSGPATSTCTVSFTAPAASSPTKPTITADYGGDSAYAASSGTTTLCGDGADLELESVSAVGRHDYGIETGGQAVLAGCGLAAGQTVQWGNEDATETLSASDISDGGASATVNVPWEATSGDVSVSDGTTTSTVGDNTIDSWRNTMGFSFHNYGDPNEPADFIQAFVGSNTTSFITIDGAPKELLAGDANLELFNAHSSDKSGPIDEEGRCFGIALLTSTFADGSTAFDRFGTAATPFGLIPQDKLQDPKPVDLTTRIQVDWWKQFSREAVSQKANAPTTADGLLSQLTSAFGANGFTHPAVISFGFYESGAEQGARIWVGHTVTAFGVRDTPDGFIVYTYDSNTEFLPAEDQHADLHAEQQANSEIIVKNDGTWSSPKEQATGNLASGALWVAPAATLEGALHVSTAPDLVAMDMVTGTDVIQADSPVSGDPVGLSSNDLGGLHVEPNEDDDTGSSLVKALATSAGDANIGELVGPTGTWRDTLADSDGPVDTVWRSGDNAASLQASKGTDTTDFSGKAGSLSIGSATHAQPSATATVALDAYTDNERQYRQASVTGHLAAMGVRIAWRGSSVVLHATHSGSVDLELSDGASSQGGNTYQIGSVSMAAGQTLRATPSSWTALANSNGVSIELSGARRPSRHLKMSNHFHPPAATLASGRLKGRALSLVVRVPRGLRGGAIIATATVRQGKRRVGQVKIAVAAGEKSRQTIVRKLRFAAPKHAVTQVVLESLSAGCHAWHGHTYKQVLMIRLI